MATDTSQADMKWFSSTPTTQLQQHISARAQLHLYSFPKSPIGIDSRTYANPISAILSLSPSCVHLLTLSTPNPASPIGIFFRASPGSAVGIEYDDDVVNLSVCKVRRDTHHVALGDRGVAALSGVAEKQWHALAKYITDDTLACAGIRQNTAVVVSESVGHSNNSPTFAPLPMLRPTSYISSKRLTAYHIDRTEYVANLITARYQGSIDRLLGDLQLAYVCFSFLGCLNALEHWTRLLRELCNSYSLDNYFSGLSEELATILDVQFQLMDTETAQLALKPELRKCLACFVSSGWEQPAVQKFTKTLNQLMGWSLTGAEDEGDDSDGPVVVEC